MPASAKGANSKKVEGKACWFDILLPAELVPRLSPGCVAKDA